MKQDATKRVTSTDLALEVDSSRTDQITVIVRLLHGRRCFIAHHYSFPDLSSIPWQWKYFLTGKRFTCEDMLLQASLVVLGLLTV